MKRRWILSLLLVLSVGAVGYGLTGEETQKVRKTSAEKIRIEYMTCEMMGMNPLCEEEYPEVSEAVREHFKEMKAHADFVEDYEDVRVYTKLGKDRDTYVAFVTYKMKIRDIYTKVPGLGTFYITKDQELGVYQVAARTEDKEVQSYIARLTGHQDVKQLFEETNVQYADAVESDAMLQEALADLRNAYEDSTGS